MRRGSLGYRLAFPGLAVPGLILLAAVVPAFSAHAKKKDAQFHARLAAEHKVSHALNRLTFGPRPGDVERVRATGLKKWIDLQLHPERIPENPVLEAKLRPLDSLRMPPMEMAENYPPPQVIRAMAAGRVPYPNDPEKRKALERVAQRFERQAKQQSAQQDQPGVQQNGQSPNAQEQDGAEQRAQATPPDRRLQLAGLLTPAQIRTIRQGTPQEKLQVFLSLPEDQQEELIQAAPPNLRQAVMARAPAELRRKMMVALAPQQIVTSDLIEGKLLRAIYSNRQLDEVLADFWFNHFNVFLDKGADRYLVTAYERDAIRPHVLGKFQDLLLATVKSPAMLFYLDNWQSVGAEAADQIASRRARGGQPAARRRRGLNENYGRELLELHTLGVNGGYTQQDVIEVARCFTGWTIERPQQGGGFWFNARMHDNREKTVLGVKIPAGGGMSDGLKVIEIVSHHPSTAHFISRKLAQRFVADEPPDSLVEKMAKTFLKTKGDIREVMRTMLASDEFWSQGAYRAKVKSPLEMVVGAVRAVGADVDFAAGLGFQIAQLGEPLYRKQEPTGYSNAGQEWVSSAALLARMNFAQALTGNKLQGVTVDGSRLVRQEEADPAAIARRLLLTDVSQATRAAITGLAATPAAGGSGAGARPLQIAGLVLGSPDFQRK